MGKQLQVEATEVFQWTWDAIETDKRFILSMGGSRSSKTYSILQVLIIKALSSTDYKEVSIVRKSLPSLKMSIMKDFFEILNKFGIYDEENHSKVDNEYMLGKWRFSFFSIDDAQKRRGSKRDILYINEGNEIEYESYFQLQVRTTEKVIVDWNPSELYWADDLIGQEDVIYIHSTYKNNNFLPPAQVKEIEKLQYTDPQYWKIYGLGEHAGSFKTIFTFDIVDGIDTEKIEKGQIKLIGLGLDWGYAADPTTLVEVWREGDKLYLNELMYKNGMTNNDIADEFRKLGIDRYTEIIADSASPKDIEDLHRKGFLIKPAKKGRDSILHGINILKQYKLCVTASSKNLQKEMNNYSWKTDKNEQIINQPEDKWNHLIDAIRYVANGRISGAGRGSGKYNIKITGNTII